MTKKILLGIGCVTLAMAMLIAIDANMQVSLHPSEGLVLENAEALAAGECGEGKVTGSPMSGKCDTPMSQDGKRKCTTSIITCQGSSNCCERKSCSLH